MLGFAISQSGDWIYLFVIPWIIAQRSESDVAASSTTAIFGGLNAFTVLAGGFIAPALMRRFAPSRLMVALNILLAVGSIALAAAYHLDWALYGLLTLSALKSGINHIYMPIDSNFQAEAFPHHETRESQSRLRNLFIGLVRIVATVAAGHLLARFGASPLLVFDSATFIAMAIIIAICATHTPPIEQETKILAVWADGLKFLADQPNWSRLLALYFLFSFQGMTTFVLTPVIVLKERGWDSVTLGWIVGSGGIGMIIASTKTMSNLLLRRGLTLSLTFYFIFAAALPLVPNRWVATGIYTALLILGTPLYLRFSNLFQGSAHRHSLIALQNMLASAAVPLIRVFVVMYFVNYVGCSTSHLLACSALVVWFICLLVYIPRRRELMELFTRTQACAEVVEADSEDVAATPTSAG